MAGLLYTVTASLLLLPLIYPAQAFTSGGIGLSLGHRLKCWGIARSLPTPTRRTIFHSPVGKRIQMANVIIVGFDPSVVDYSKWPDLNPEKLLASLEENRVLVSELGHHVDDCMVDLGETAESRLTKALKTKDYDCVILGAGLRTSEEHFLLFEKLLNVVHEHAPKARICFNTNPFDTAAAVQRWV
eukprot:CAMPEP_0202809498 /NCGR_PEP_ID=MMETSP1389-20130828/1802_1 /ASSEMBLY_ACC=CAM_ASM_000865 /TAXON_ID=302021 /ORGANISM="Rhodomonas sp., Strain CCMP768" /LENGTH=185 /DNA_ID=CAMNT_0049480125 /DNA_START=24 /DNA_END=581 /DNA_ORIENTATION=-